uniref:Myb/SANT-like domain-containing protein n=1 Tax=Setaria viridis TaxID=4556 RepID=A0A4U6VIJ6_SETVI|nr:hypothetical protein SEVIR_3G335700v2 [Setaria viridis]
MAGGLDVEISNEFLIASQASSTPVAQARKRAASANKRARDDEGDQMDWNDGYTTIVCKLFAEQVRKGNRPNTHLNNVGYAEDIPGVGKFKNRPLQNEDELKVMFGNIINEEQDHWNPMSSNPIIPPSQEAPNPMSSNFIDAEDGCTTLVIQEHISKISENASSFVASRQAGITIEQVMGHVAACGSDENFVATKFFVKKEHRKMFMTIPTNEARLSWLKRKYIMMFAE